MATIQVETILKRWNARQNHNDLTKVIAAVGGGLLVGYTVGHLIVGARKELARREIGELLSGSDSIAEEWTEVGEDVRARWANIMMMDQEQDRAYQIETALRGDDPLYDEFSSEAPASGEAPPNRIEGGNPPPHLVVQRRGRVEYSGECQEVRRHRKIRHRKLYIQAVVAECKNRFGTPMDTPANHLAVRRFALDRMTAHNVRPTHIYQVLPLVVELVFCKATHEEEAEQLAKMYRFQPWWSRLRTWLTGPRVDDTMC
jgi:hypothetical protein